MLFRDLDNKEKPDLKADTIRLIYSLLLILAVPISFLMLWVRSIKSKTSVPSSQFNRLGIGFKTAEQGGVLIHCVSVGEVVAAASLIKQIRDKVPQLPIYMTTTTESGSQRANQLFNDTVDLFYLPMDIPFFVSPMLRNLNPSKVLITEVELWPNFIHGCYRRAIPTYVINARMTDRSAQRYQKIKALFTPMLQKLSGVCAQGQRDFENYRLLGMDSKRLHLTNNIKFDRDVSERHGKSNLKSLHNIQERYVFVAGSTHDGEELLTINAFKQLKNKFPALILILVPRHPQRFDKVHQLCIEQNVVVNRITTESVCSASTDVLLVDAMGKLEDFYQIANLAFVGGSVNPRGGHNALEPAAYGIPIMMGASRYNNPVICEALADAGALELTDNLEQLVNVASIWLSEPDKAERAGDSGKQVIINNQGAVEATLAVLGYN